MTMEQRDDASLQDGIDAMTLSPILSCSTNTVKNLTLETTLNEICEGCNMSLDLGQGFNENATVSNLLHSKHLFNAVKTSIPNLSQYLLTKCGEPIRDYLSKYSESIESPLEAILEQLRLFNTVHPSISSPLIREVDVKCMRKENIPTDPNIINMQLPLHILREFVQLEPPLTQHFRYVQIVIQKLVLELIKAKRKTFLEPYLFQRDNIILGLVAAVGNRNDHLSFVHPIVIEMAKEISSWIKSGNSINSNPEYAFTVFPLNELLEDRLGVEFFDNTLGVINDADLSSSDKLPMIIQCALEDPCGKIWKSKVSPYVREQVRMAFEKHRSKAASTSETDRASSIFKNLEKIEPLRRVPGYVDSGNEDRGPRVVFDYGKAVPENKFNSLLSYMRQGPEHAQYRTALMVAPSGAGKSFSSTYLAKTGASPNEMCTLYTIPFSDEILENLSSTAKVLDRFAAEIRYRVCLAAHLLVLYSCLTLETGDTLCPLDIFKFLRNGGQACVTDIRKKLDSTMGKYLTTEGSGIAQRKAIIRSKLLLQKSKDLVRHALEPLHATFCVVFDETQRCLTGKFPRNQYSSAPSQDGNMFTVIQSITSTVCNQYVIGTNLKLEAIESALSGFSKHHVRNFFDSLTPATFEQSKELLSFYLGDGLTQALDKVDPFPLYNTRFRMFDVLLDCMADKASEFMEHEPQLDLFLAASLHEAFQRFSDTTLRQSFTNYYSTVPHKQVIDELVLFGAVQQGQLEKESRQALAHGFCYTKAASKNVTDKTDFINSELPMQCIMQNLVRKAHCPSGTTPFVSSFARLADRSDVHGREATLELFLPLVLLTAKEPLQFLTSIMEESMAKNFKNREFKAQFMYRSQPYILDSQEQNKATVHDVKQDPFFGLLRYTNLVKPEYRFDPKLSNYALLPGVIILPSERLGPDALFLLMHKDGTEPAMLVTVSCTVERKQKKLKKDFHRLSPENFFSGNDVSEELRNIMKSLLVDTSSLQDIPVLRIMVMPKGIYNLQCLSSSIELLDKEGFCGKVKSQDGRRKDLVLLLSNKNKRFTEALKDLPEELASVWPKMQKRTEATKGDATTEDLDLYRSVTPFETQVEFQISSENSVLNGREYDQGILPITLKSGEAIQYLRHEKGEKVVVKLLAFDEDQVRNRDPIILEHLIRELEREERKGVGLPLAITKLNESQQNSLGAFIHAILMPNYGGTTDLNSFSLSAIRSICKQLLQVVATLHSKRVLHLDIKPSNIMFDCAASPPFATIIDFGHSIIMPEDRNLNGKVAASTFNADNAHIPRGTGMYTPPEMCRDKKRPKFTKNADVYSLGVTLFELCIDEDVIDNLAENRGGTGLPSLTEARELTQRIQDYKITIDWKKELNPLLDLIKHMTKENYEERYTVEEALAHNFFQE